VTLERWRWESSDSHRIPGWNCLKLRNPGSDLGFEGLRGPGETWRDFGFPKNQFFWLHAYVSRVIYVVKRVTVPLGHPVSV
jgi:hypothetical protein